MSESRLTLDTDSQVFFYEQDHYYLSNFSAFNVRWSLHTFPTSEHAYQWSKFWGTGNDSLMLGVLHAPSAHEAFVLAGEYRNYVRQDWPTVKSEIMRGILWAKTQQHEYVRRKLLQTGDRELIENSWRDDVWGWGPNRDGQNLLGKLWMRVREDLRATAK
jgi:N-glycosidase YbiA